MKMFVFFFSENYVYEYKDFNEKSIIDNIIFVT